MIISFFLTGAVKNNSGIPHPLYPCRTRVGIPEMDFPRGSQGLAEPTNTSQRLQTERVQPPANVLAVRAVVAPKPYFSAARAFTGRKAKIGRAHV
mgnify:FL=1